MEQIKSLALTICVTAVATGIFSLLIPNNSFEKVMRFSVSLFFIIGIASPILSKDIFSFSLDLSNLKPPPEITAFKADTDNQFVNLAVSNIEKDIKASLEQVDLDIKTVRVLVNQQENKTVSIDKVVIITGKDTTKAKEEEIITLVCSKLSVASEQVIISRRE